MRAITVLPMLLFLSTAALTCPVPSSYERLAADSDIRWSCLWPDEGVFIDCAHYPMDDTAAAIYRERSEIKTVVLF